jgi:hypothetical protein
MNIRTIAWLALSGILLSASMPPLAMASAQAPAAGQISGTARSSAGKSLANHTARVRDVQSSNIVGTATTNAAGEFSIAGLQPGQYVVEIVNAAGEVVGATSPVSLTAGAMVVSGVSATATAAAAAAVGGIGAFFTSMPVILGAAVASGITAGAIATRDPASPAR